MSERHAELDAALDRVVDAARTHLAAIKEADGRVDDNHVWKTYVDLNNASFAYDELLLDVFGEVTPWDVEPIDPEEADEKWGVGLGGVDGSEPRDAEPITIAVRQRRDYVVPSVAALLRVAEAARRSVAHAEDEETEEVGNVGDAVVELLHAGDGTLGALDIPELEPLDGVVAINQVRVALDLTSDPDDDDTPFSLGADDPLLCRLDERALAEDEVDEG